MGGDAVDFGERVGEVVSFGEIIGGWSVAPFAGEIGEDDGQGSDSAVL